MGRPRAAAVQMLRFVCAQPWARRTHAAIGSLLQLKCSETVVFGQNSHSDSLNLKRTPDPESEKLSGQQAPRGVEAPTFMKISLTALETKRTMVGLHCSRVEFLGKVRFMNKTLRAFAGVAAFAAAATTAHAAPTITYSSSSPDTFSASFGNTTPASTFSDFFMPFTVTVSGILNATLTTIGIIPANDVDFSQASIVSIPGPGGSIPFDIVKSSISSTNPPRTNPDGLENGLISGVLIQPGTYQVRVAGTSGRSASYSGTLSFAAAGAVPEPATWALLILGFGMIGFGMRRQRARGQAPAGYRVSYAA